jgi:hypothetical protein
MHACMYVYFFNVTDIFKFQKLILYYTSPAFLLAGGVDGICLAQDRSQWLICEHSTDVSGSIKAKHFWLADNY